MIELTALEQEVLNELNAESDANGHDFGVMECVSWKNRKQLGGVVSQLVQKGVIDLVDDVQIIDGERVTQYYLNDNYKV